MPSFDDRFLARFKKDLLSDHARSQHRNALFVGAVGIVAAWLKLKPVAISVVGLTIDQEGSPRIFRGVLLAAVVYFALAFAFAAYADMLNWWENHQEARAVEAHLPANIKMYEDLPAQGPGTSPDVDSGHAQQQLKDTETRVKRYRTLLAVDWVRAFLDFVLPLCVCAGAIVFLAWRIW